MPVEIDLGMPPLGYAVSPARTGQSAYVRVCEFISTEDGSHFIQRLEGIPDDILHKLPEPVRPSSVDHMLAICQHNGKAKVWVNELRITATSRVARAIDAGEHITKDDIVDVEGIDLGVPISADTGVLFLFSVGWRKGLFYDFHPISGTHRRPRDYDIVGVLGRLYCHVMFQERFSITEQEWRALFSAKWFPFAGLRNETISRLLGQIRSDWEPDEILSDVIVEVKQYTEGMLNGWRRHPSFERHLPLLEQAIERFQNDDPMSCTALLFPRIEGIMRTHSLLSGATTGFRQEKLVQTAVASKIDNIYSALLPHRFSEYLREVYFKHFSPTEHSVDVSRHTVGHGVADAAKFDKKSAVIALLTLHQLFYFLEKKLDDTTDP